MNKASNAVLAKARTKYAKRLRANDYSNLMSCSTNSEIANYLKTKTVYSKIFASPFNITEITAEIIEFNLNKYLDESIEEICRFENTINDDFFAYFVLKSDMKVILSAARNLVSDYSRAFSFMPTDFFKKKSELKIKKLYESSNAKELIKALQRTKYSKVAKDFIGEDNFFDISRVEVLLYDYYATASKQIAEKFDKKTRKEFDHIIDLKIDNFNVCYIYRQKKQGVNTDEIRKNLILQHGTIANSKLLDILNAQNDHDFVELIKTTKIGKGVSMEDLSYIEGVFEYNLWKINKHYLRFSTNPNICVLAYINLSMNEIKNVVHIVEGKRYNMSNEEIQKYLIGIDE